MKDKRRRQRVCLSVSLCAWSTHYI